MEFWAVKADRAPFLQRVALASFALAKLENIVEDRTAPEKKKGKFSQHVKFLVSVHCRVLYVRLFGSDSH